MFGNFKTTAFAAFAAAFAAAPALADEPDGLILPPGFHASVVADGLAGAVIWRSGPMAICMFPPPRRAASRLPA